MMHALIQEISGLLDDREQSAREKLEQGQIFHLKSARLHKPLVWSCITPPRVADTQLQRQDTP